MLERDTIGSMTVAELRTFVAGIVDEKVSRPRRHKKYSPDELQEVFDYVDEHMWTPPPDAPSSLELLREDRDR